MVSELLRARLRLLVLTAIAAGLAGCSSEATRFNDNRYSDNRYPTRPSASVEPTSATAMAPSMPPATASYGRIEQNSLPPPSGASVPVAPEAGYVGGGRSMGMASYQPTPTPPPTPAPLEITGSATPRKPNSPPNSPWSWEGGTAIIVAPGETIDIIAQRHGVPATALIEANSLPPGAAVRPGQRLVIPRYVGGAPSTAPSASAAAPRPTPTPPAALTPAQQPAPVTGSSGLHVVAAGDTLYRISRTYGRSVADLAKANNIEPTATLKIGDRIVIPGGSTTASTSAPKSLPKSTPKAAQPLATPSTAKAATPKATPAKAAPAPKPEASQQAAVVTPTDETPTPAVAKSDGTPSFRWPVKGRVIAGFGPKPNGQQNDGINLAVPEGTPIKAAEDGVVAYAGNELKGYGNLVLIRHANGYVTAYAHAKELLVKRGDQIKRGQVIANSGQTGNVDTPQLHFEVRKGPAPLDPMPLLSGG
jgi:murein DD-endopeptidase MepM/ murein hydrolase activator NlpD